MEIFGTCATIVLLLLLSWMCFHLIRRESSNIATFVPFNVTEASDALQPDQWRSVHDRFGSLVQTVNQTTFALSYRMDDMLTALKTVLETVAKGKYAILSIGEQQHFALQDVIIQEVDTLAMVKFASVDFVLESMNPFRIQKVVLTMDPLYNNSQDVKPSNTLGGPGLFQLSNPLHLFYPYNTSDNRMAITTTDVDVATDKIAYVAAPLISSASTA